MICSAPQAQTWIVDHDPISVVTLDDPVVEAVGFAAESRYAETYWLPVLGPSALWALRRLTALLAMRPSGIAVPMGMLGSELGLGGNGGRHAPAVRAVGRLVLFGMAEVRGDELAVRRKVPPLARRQLRRLPTHLVEAHQRHHSAGAATTHQQTGPTTPASQSLREPASRSEPARGEQRVGEARLLTPPATLTRPAEGPLRVC
jgi:hypothetical protein